VFLQSSATARHYECRSATRPGPSRVISATHLATVWTHAAASVSARASCPDAPCLSNLHDGRQSSLLSALRLPESDWLSGFDNPYQQPPSLCFAKEQSSEIVQTCKVQHFWMGRRITVRPRDVE
jgi:hypothetical protein